ncbi:hypothetical protein EJ03DRAFT_348640 [Teratosphaeria nubilosa]|uniref:Ribonucleases P/MRP subunit Pop8-like domain-containing protein n=1 Tax=Teratosphaeria nubilosa TaxID=161662 RepID=A0A6G1LH19_9PEZI|nr:hypothetical protein EJ03DRAFT_348640 [Teratosphaeria nubilosa]
MATDPSIPSITENTALTAPTTQPTPSSPTTTTTTTAKTAKPHKRKRKPKSSPISTTMTLHAPQWCYIHLRHLSSATSTSPDLDLVTSHLHLLQPLSRFLGLHGSSTPLDILKLDGTDVWIRIPAEDREVLVAAVGGWVGAKGEGWRVMGSSSWDVRAQGREEARDLFG